ncbi:amino acid/amide ABC transporter ATP-binding protein 1, HAAT family [Bradyrhizobium sp. Rc2d]|uniref:ABC transporter ATP-binding protein n=1 Tax=Bradyrhizobium sp. Rc2d TaxID=1855321 RepID=UPI0008858ED1|nr:ABC transporter ATP-binding protein [Bradyrhizobium sp. Rc2d]SDG42960.1 amino acid/amide ABC transporter ATP-binding protein 1, HAAT family [Bradyrhizobium sp. Rc2d]
MSLVATSGGHALILARAQERAAGAALETGGGPSADEAAALVSGAAVPVLRLEGISLGFGGVTALDAIDLAVANGEIRAIIGPNGAGKSSLLNVVSGLYRPDHGVVRLGSERFTHVPTARLAAHGVARTFQNLALFKGLPVLDNVIMGLVHCRQAGFVRQMLSTPQARREEAEARTAAEELIAFLHLDAVKHQLAGGLPYGIQKRVELARALVARPQLLLLDEPLAGVTLGEKQELAAHVRNARDAYGTTIMLIEHDIGVVMGLSDRIAVLDYGRKIADGTPEEVRSDQAVIDAYLGVAHEGEAELVI